MACAPTQTLGRSKTVCIDRGYYGPIAKPDFQRYCAPVPDDFRFIVKADGAVTQSSLRSGKNWLDSPQFLNAEYATRNIVAPYAEGLDQKASVLLFQFPPVNAELRRQPTQFAERLHDFVTALPAGIRYAIEIRDAQLRRTLLHRIASTHATAAAAAQPHGGSVIWSVNRALELTS